MDARQAAVARALIDHDSRTPLQFKPADTNVVAGASGQEVEYAFSDMEDDGWIEGVGRRSATPSFGLISA
jgi:hypothetical protein